MSGEIINCPNPDCDGRIEHGKPCPVCLHTVGIENCACDWCIPDDDVWYDDDDDEITSSPDPSEKAEGQ